MQAGGGLSGLFRLTRERIFQAVAQQPGHGQEQPGHSQPGEGAAEHGGRGGKHADLSEDRDRAAGRPETLDETVQTEPRRS